MKYFLILYIIFLILSNFLIYCTNSYELPTLPGFHCCFNFSLAMQQFYVEHPMTVYVLRTQILLERINLIQ